MIYNLRQWHISDLDNLVTAANNYNISKNLTNKFPFPYNAENGKSFINMATDKENSATIFCIEIDQKASGGIGIHPQDDIFLKNAELGYWLAEPYWGQGIITSAINEVVLFGFNNYDIDRIFARPFGSNIGSQKVLEKAGFILEAKLEKTIFKNGTYEDELVYGIRRS